MTFLSVLSILFAAIANGIGSAMIRYSSLYKGKADSSIALYWILLLGAFFIFGGAFPLYAYGLSKIKLSVAQPLFSVFTYLSVALIAFFIFNEPYSFRKIFGLVLILSGVILVAQSK